MDKVKDRQEEIKLLFEDMKLFYGKYLTNDDIDRYIEYLGDYDYQDIYKSIKRIIYYQDKFPTISQIINNIPIEFESRIKD